MDSHLIYKTSEKMKYKVEWIKPTETEWLYCGAKGEVKFDIIEKHVDEFFSCKKLYVSSSRSASFETNSKVLIDAIEDIVGATDFLVWTEDFQFVIEFNKIGVFRKGKYSANINLPNNKISYNKIKPTSPDKVRGKLVKYRKGDCLSLAVENGKYMAVFISEKFNKFYDFIPLEYFNEKKPSLQEFLEGRFFGKYIDTIEGVLTTVEKHMIPCLDADEDLNIRKIGSLDLIDSLMAGSYRYIKSVKELFEYYIEDVPLRSQRTSKFDQYPDQLFISDRLIEMKKILKQKP